jgi:hypothetical protein
MAAGHVPEADGEGAAGPAAGRELDGVGAGVSRDVARDRIRPAVDRILAAWASA